MTAIENPQPTTGEAMQERVRKFEHEHPEVKKALDLFNVSLEHYEAALRAMQPRTYVTTHTLLPVQHG